VLLQWLTTIKIIFRNEKNTLTGGAGFSLIPR
jgi:hypothetical protein